MSFPRWINALRPRKPLPHRNQYRPILERLEDRLAPATGLTSGNQQLLSAYGQLPLSFEANQGQTAAQVQYLTQGSGYSLFLTSSGAVLSLTKPTAKATATEPDAPARDSAAALAGASGSESANPAGETTGVALALNLVGSNPNAAVTGLDQLPGTSNYFIGNDPRQWHTGIANYSKVEYQNVYPGINLVYYGNQQQLEYDYQLAPGADPSSIRFAVQGADSVTLDAQGNLVLHTATGDVLEHAPVIYQQVAGAQQPVSGQFVLLGNNEVGFQVGAYDATLPLVIDPVLSYSTYLGGNGNDSGNSITVDASGNAYVTGQTSSTNFPTTVGASYGGGNYDVFVAKLSANGTGLIYSTYMGGNQADVGRGIAVDGAGDAYVTGYTQSANFPTTAEAFQTNSSVSSGNDHAFVTELNPSGTALVYSTYLGGIGSEDGNGIALDGSGNAYVTGRTLSANFPTIAGAFQTSHASDNANDDAFVTKLNSTGTGLIYSTFLGGNGGDLGQSIAVDTSGNAYVTGSTTSTNFPTTAGAFQTSHGNDNTNDDAFVAKLNANGTALIYSTYLGGNSLDFGNGIAVDGSGNAYVTGIVASTDFPTTSGTVQSSYCGNIDAFVTKLNASGTALVYSTYLGGTSRDYGEGIAVDGSGEAYVTGYTNSASLPTTSHAFVTKLNAAGAVTVYSTSLDVSGNGYGFGIALDNSGNAYVTGGTGSTSFPTTTGGFQTILGGGSDAFVAKLEIATPTVAIIAPAAGSLNGGTIVTITGTGFTNATAVMFGSTAAASFTIVSDTQITATTPAGTGIVDVTVISPGGTSATSTADQFTYAIWNQFNGNAQHTGISTVAAQPTDQILWQTSINLAGSFFWHTGEPVFTPSNTVIVPVKVSSSGQATGTANYELEAFNGNTGALLWTATSQYISPSNGWLPPYQPVYDPVTNRVYFAGLGGTLEYISNPDNPGSSTPTPVQVAFYGTANYTANESAYNSSISINTPLTVDNSGNIFFGFQETGSNPSSIGDGGIARISATGAGTYVTTGTAVGSGSGAPAVGSAPALSNDSSILYVALLDSGASYLVGVNATTLAPAYSVNLSVPNSDTGVVLEGLSTAAPMVAPDGTVYMGVFITGDRGFMTHYSADLATEYTPGAFGWDDTASIIPASMVPSYTGSSSYLILTKYNNYVAAETGTYGGNGVNEIAVLDPSATQTDTNNDPNPNMLVMKEIMTMTSPTQDSGWINSGYPDATREWCTNGTVVDPATDSVFINNEDGYSYRWNLATDTITQAVEITNGYGEPYTPTAIGPNGVVYAINGGTLFALGGYSNYTLTDVSSLTPPVVGQAVTFTTTLASTNGGAVPTGSITYTYTSGVNNPDNSTPVTLGTVSLVNGVATFTTSALVPNHYHIIASYSGDTADGYAAGATTLVQAVLETTTTSLTSSASPVSTGQSVTFTATVTPAGTSFVPIGTVSFYDGATLLGTAKLNSSDQAALATSSLPAGIDAITAVYNGDVNFNGSTSPILSESVGPTTTTLTDNGPNPSNYGDAVSFTAAVSGGSAIDGETVFIEDASNSNAVVAAPTLSGGAVSFTISNLTVGSHNLFAVYNGDSTHASSNSSLTPVTQVVNATAPAPAVASVVVNGGTPAYTDSNGLAVNLSGQNSVVEQILVIFNEAVALDAGAFTITNNAAGVTVNHGPTPNTAAVTASFAVVPSSGNTQFIVTFSGPGTTAIPGGTGNVIKDGLYVLNTVGLHVHANGQTAASNNTGFWALYGSAANDNILSGTIGDRNSEVFVDNFDYSLLKDAFGSESDIPTGPPAYNPALDGDLNGYVDNFDYSAFKSNFGADWTF